jgi:trans-2,3-dihydro-3-hydroxyanthranilate isomerase
VGPLNDRLGIAQALGIEVEDIGCDMYEPGVYTAGVPYHIVPVRDASVLRKIRINRGIWDSVFSHDRHSAYIFTQTPDEADNDFAARMFGMGIGEDPGTGSAAAALIGLLAEHAQLATGQVDYVLRQGHEMGRPCRITIQLRKDNDILIHGGIGGHAVIVAEGVLDLD